MPTCSSSVVRVQRSLCEGQMATHARNHVAVLDSARLSALLARQRAAFLLDGPVRVESPTSFRWKAHPVELHSTVVAADRPHSFAIVADARGLHAERAFTIRPTPDGLSTVVVSHETQVGLLPWLGRLFLAPRLHAANEAMFDDLGRAAGHQP
jgi:hypothetical protein